MTMFKGTKTCFFICMLVLTSVTLTITGVVFSRIHSEDDLETEILKSLYCQCGCGRIAYDCLRMDCDMVKSYWKNRIARELAAGKTKDQIINGFVEEYGEKVLVFKEAPPPPPPWEPYTIAVVVAIAVIGIAILYRKMRVKIKK